MGIYYNIMLNKNPNSNHKYQQRGSQSASNGMKKSISIIIVTYNSARTVEKCLISIKAQQEVYAQTIVVDNASSDATVDKVSKLNPDYLIKRKTNGGFAMAANEGAKIATNHYLLFLNPDAELKEKAIWELVREMERDDQIALVGGKFVSKDGQPMVSFGNFPSVKTEIIQKLKLHKILPWSRYVAPSFLSKRLFQKTHPVDWVSGGFCLVRKSAFDEIKGFDENYFLYLEDIDLSKRIHNLGCQIIFCPKAVAVHHQRLSASEEERKYEKESLEYYRNKFK
ncbi:MAG: hypothetical protein COY66_05515 [Candidatus Kerfeldbacteria bacterium CG_4_10_14_0_8_um_filter_42_10]|uniref:Glycosyltransferase 2-like domain-containing protein n=1 Tax=Candidatus Kerfeldbacteria bacterium CG_4_10_14_0_8_um_filter_42_10 TaxID=2014248 RepID=A0A2M7RGT0_9BACT|nr:MAG: hypothetical protein COY66_05515 [Candidatus Kerfeldbacteria bacterium CG_4_10_14_0_8_um_filter_42_10]